MWFPGMAKEMHFSILYSVLNVSNHLIGIWGPSYSNLGNHSVSFLIPTNTVAVRCCYVQLFDSIILKGIKGKWHHRGQGVVWNPFSALDSAKSFCKSPPNDSAPTHDVSEDGCPLVFLISPLGGWSCNLRSHLPHPDSDDSGHLPKVHQESHQQ